MIDSGCDVHARIKKDHLEMVFFYSYEEFE